MYKNEAGNKRTMKIHFFLILFNKLIGPEKFSFSCLAPCQSLVCFVYLMFYLGSQIFEIFEKVYEMIH